MKAIKILYNKKKDTIKIETIDPKKFNKLGINLTQYIDIISDSIVELEQIEEKYIGYLKKEVDKK